MIAYGIEIKKCMRISVIILERNFTQGFFVVTYRARSGYSGFFPHLLII